MTMTWPLFCSGFSELKEISTVPMAIFIAAKIATLGRASYFFPEDLFFAQSDAAGFRISSVNQYRDISEQ